MQQFQTKAPGISHQVFNPASHSISYFKRPVINHPEIGLAFPFQPSIRSSAAGVTILNDALDSLKSCIQRTLDPRYEKDLLKRAEKLFAGLNYQTDRKSVAMIFSAEKDAVYYLDYVVVPSIISAKNITLLDLAASLQVKPEFFMLALCHKQVTIYEYYNNKLNLSYKETKKDISDQSLRHARNTLKQMNKGFNKPVFISGETSIVQDFVAHTDFYQVVFKTPVLHDPCSVIYLNNAARNICVEWPYWQNKFLQGRILMELRQGALSRADTVLNALSENVNGTLLIHDTFYKKLKELAPGTNSIQENKNWIDQVEAFFARGNRVFVTRKRDFNNKFNVMLLPKNAGSELVVKKLGLQGNTPVQFIVL